MIHTKKHRCNGDRIIWPWKGYPCGARAKVFYQEKWWCKNHVPLCNKQPCENSFRNDEYEAKTKSRKLPASKGTMLLRVGKVQERSHKSRGKRNQRWLS